MNSWEPDFKKGKNMVKYDLEERLPHVLSKTRRDKKLKANHQEYLDHQRNSG